MLSRLHFFPGFCLLVLGLGLQGLILRLLAELKVGRRALLTGGLVSSALLVSGYLLEFHRVQQRFPVQWSTWLECASIIETICLMVCYPALLTWRKSREYKPVRRAFLQTAAAGLALAPLAAASFGILERNRLQVTEVKIPIPKLPKDLDGLRIVQVTDIHLSPFLSEREFARAVDMANETRAHIGLVTGDLISRRGDPLDACLRQLARLRAEAGILWCLGNHEVYTRTEDYVTAEGRRIGIDFLRNRARQLRFGSAVLNFAGVDYQKYRSPYLLGAERMVAPGAVNILLSHNPDVFPVAALQGYDLTIAGHTHGGQVDVEILHQHMDVARFYTPYVLGLYREGASSVYVSSGIGTIGVPIRIGAAPEISLIQLCAT
jgi:predicted MPP superfamily phosphohydrolase